MPPVFRICSGSENRAASGIVPTRGANTDRLQPVRWTIIASFGDFLAILHNLQRIPRIGRTGAVLVSGKRSRHLVSDTGRIPNRRLSVDWQILLRYGYTVRVKPVGGVVWTPCWTLCGRQKSGLIYHGMGLELVITRGVLSLSLSLSLSLCVCGGERERACVWEVRNIVNDSMIDNKFPMKLSLLRLFSIPFRHSKLFL